MIILSLVHTVKSLAKLGGLPRDVPSMCPTACPSEPPKSSQIRKMQASNKISWFSKNRKMQASNKISWFSKNRDFENPRLFQSLLKPPSIFAPKFLLASSPDPLVGCLLKTSEKVPVSLELQTENLWKVSETFCFWWQKVWRAPKPAVFRRMALKNTLYEKKGRRTEGLEGHAPQLSFLGNFVARDRICSDRHGNVSERQQKHFFSPWLGDMLLACTSHFYHPGGHAE